MVIRVGSTTLALRGSLRAKFIKYHVGYGLLRKVGNRKTDGGQGGRSFTNISLLASTEKSVSTPRAAEVRDKGTEVPQHSGFAFRRSRSSDDEAAGECDHYSTGIPLFKMVDPESYHQGSNRSITGQFFV